MHLSVNGEELLAQCKGRMQAGPVMHHPFLLEFEKGDLDRLRLSAFLIQWFKMSTAHRHAFPALIANIKDDDIRFDLIDILNEEYGSGDRSRIHIRLLEKLLRAADVDLGEACSVAARRSVGIFETELLRLWSSEPAPLAFGVHFALEYLASAQQHYCALGMRRYSFLTDVDREYFDLHAEAEIRHVAASERGFLQYARDTNDGMAVVEGVEIAERLLGAVWDDFYSLLYVELSP
jgi:pyrroloquinoline quinone (PQQ) biosynthesis protein C